MAVILDCSTLTPLADITCPRNSTFSRKRAHLDSFMKSLFYFKRPKTSLSNWMCSSCVLE